MSCKKPYFGSGSKVGYDCGHCSGCRRTFVLHKANRLYFESISAGPMKTTLVSLTYCDGHLPVGIRGLPIEAKDDVRSSNVEFEAMLDRIASEKPRCVGAVLYRPHLDKFVKDLRNRLKRHYNLTLRFKAAAEYGSDNGRPHFHLLIYGIDYYLDIDGQLPHLIRECWPYGGADIQYAGKGSFMYVAKYMYKRMTDEGDPWLLGRPAEFACGGQRDGFGKRFVDQLAKDIKANDAFWEHVMSDGGDVPRYVKLGRKKLYLDRFLLGYLRKQFYSKERIREICAERTMIESKRICEVMVSALQSGEVLVTPFKIYFSEYEGRLIKEEARARMDKLKGTVGRSP